MPVFFSLDFHIQSLKFGRIKFEYVKILKKKNCFTPLDFKI
jgi:hypothetical protein